MTEGSLSPQDSISLQVVVVTFNPGDHLERCLSSLSAAVTSTYQVTLVDNGSIDGAPHRAASAEGVSLVESPSNVGYGAAANLGARESASEWLLVCNPDVVFHPGAIDALLDAARRWPRAGVLGPAIVTEDGLLYPSSRQLPSLGRGVMHALLGWWYPGNRWTAAYRREREAPTEGTTGWLSGSAMLLRRKAFHSVEGFDPGFFMYFEDLDLCERINTAGWQVVYVPSAMVMHVGAHSTSTQAEAMSRAHHESAWRYLSRHYGRWYQAPLRIVLRLGLAVRFQLSRLAPQMGHGARPTRGAGVLPPQ
jgi:N-acetylglucosaminyl-diphospho-decaprenol L-rhamnosyltransferase